MSYDPFMTEFDLICIFCLGSQAANLHAKFEVSSFIRAPDMEGVPKFHKGGHGTPPQPLLT